MYIVVNAHITRAVHTRFTKTLTKTNAYTQPFLAYNSLNTDKQYLQSMYTKVFLRVLAVAAWDGELASTEISLTHNHLPPALQAAVFACLDSHINVSLVHALVGARGHRRQPTFRCNWQFQ